MKKKTEDTISILISVPGHENTGQSAMFPSPRAMVAKSAEISIEALEESLSKIVSKLQTLAERLTESDSLFCIDTLTFALTVDGSGKISLIGEVSAGVSAGITVSIRRRSPSK